MAGWDASSWSDFGVFCFILKVTEERHVPGRLVSGPAPGLGR